MNTRRTRRRDDDDDDEQQLSQRPRLHSTGSGGTSGVGGSSRGSQAVAHRQPSRRPTTTSRLPRPVNPTSRLADVAWQVEVVTIRWPVSPRLIYSAYKCFYGELQKAANGLPDVSPKLLERMPAPKTTDPVLALLNSFVLTDGLQRIAGITHLSFRRLLVLISGFIRGISDASLTQSYKNLIDQVGKVCDTKPITLASLRNAYHEYTDNFDRISRGARLTLKISRFLSRCIFNEFCDELNTPVSVRTRDREPRRRFIFLLIHLELIIGNIGDALLDECFYNLVREAQYDGFGVPTSLRNAFDLFHDRFGYFPDSESIQSWMPNIPTRDQLFPTPTSSSASVASTNTSSFATSAQEVHPWPGWSSPSKPVSATIAAQHARSLALFKPLPQFCQLTRTQPSSGSMVQGRSKIPRIGLIKIDGIDRRFLQLIIPGGSLYCQVYEDARRIADAECSVCKAELFDVDDDDTDWTNSKDWIVVTECLHFSHGDCFLRWQEQTSNCPVCRGEKKLLFIISKSLGRESSYISKMGHRDN